MIYKAILKYDVNINRYFIPAEMIMQNSALYYIHLALDPYQDPWVKIDMDADSVLIRSQDNFKQPAKIDFKLELDQVNFEEAYDRYCDKRWDEMPKVELSPSDWEELQQKWKQIKEDKPEYVIFVLDDSGPLDKVNVIGKNELSEQDVQDMTLEHERYLAWQKAKELYNEDHEIIDDIWHGPADSAYDVDIEKYLHRDVGFVQHKRYTKSEVVLELQDRLRKKEPVYSIIHWLTVRSAYGIEGADEPFVELLQQLQLMDLGWKKMICEEKLKEVADRLLLGQDVTL